MELSSKSRIFKCIVKMRLNQQGTAVGNCPDCGKELIAYISENHYNATLVTCTKCLEIFKVEINNEPLAAVPMPARGQEPHSFLVFYQLQPVFENEHHANWDTFFDCIMSTLFETYGEVHEVQNGFQCVPDEAHAGEPIMTVDKADKVVCFMVFGFSERQASQTIRSAVKKFGENFRTSLSPLRFECWSHANKTNPVLVEARDLSKKEEINPKLLRFFGPKIGNA